MLQGMSFSKLCRELLSQHSHQQQGTGKADL
jgi:hypothetical protein